MIDGKLAGEIAIAHPASKLAEGIDVAPARETAGQIKGRARGQDQAGQLIEVGETGPVGPEAPREPGEIKRMGEDGVGRDYRGAGREVGRKGVGPRLVDVDQGPADDRRGEGLPVLQPATRQGEGALPLFPTASRASSSPENRTLRPASS